MLSQKPGRLLGKCEWHESQLATLLDTTYKPAFLVML